MPLCNYDHTPRHRGVYSSRLRAAQLLTSMGRTDR